VLSFAVTLLATLLALLLAGFFALRRRLGLAFMCLACLFLLFRPGMAQASEFCKPTKYADGDAITFISDGEKIRLRVAGYDSPEHGQPFSRVATQRLREFTQWGARCDCYKRDRHGRNVCTVTTLTGQSVAAVMLRAGLGCIDSRFEGEAHPTDRRAARDALEAAQAVRAGIWSLTNPQCAVEFRIEKSAK
jgi:endonuclease YncB( thermonuclease family)